ncbi:MAG: hypothetical protein GXP48_06685, partial [Acidobacteria bacterium]|nr:hypothetical protein [Acidobacteriota bacterium]
PGELAPAWLGSNRLAVVAVAASGVGQVVVHDVGGRTDMLLDFVDLTVLDSYELQGFGNGWVALPGPGLVRRMTRRGGAFRFEDVSLHPGRQQFVARQLADGQTAESQPIEVTVRRNAYPDAAVGALTATPSDPLVGEQALIAGSVSNQGSVSLDACPVVLYRIDPDGAATAVLRTSVTLAPGKSVPIRYRWEGSSSPADVQWILAADPDGVVDESDETNNTATLTVPVRSSTVLEVNVALDRAQCAPGDLVTVSAEVLATGRPEAVHVEIAAQDAAGAPVETLDTRDLAAFSGRTGYDLVWTVPEVAEGAYRVRIAASTPSGRSAEAVAELTVAAPGLPDVSVATGKTVYKVGEMVNVTGTIHNPASVSRAGLAAAFEIADAGGAAVASKVVTLSPIPAGGAITVPWTWLSAGAAPGSYHVTCAVVEASGGSERARSAPFAFKLSAGGPVLSGGVSVSPARLEPSGSLAVVGEIRNGGPDEIKGLPVTVTLVDPASWGVLASAAGVVDVPPSSSVEFDAALPVDGLPLGQYLAVLLAGSGTQQQLATAAVTIADLTPPELQLISPTSAVVSGETTIAVHARDALTGVAEVHYTVDGDERQYPLLLQPGVEGGDVYSATWSFQPGDEGQHQIVIGASDVAGNQSEGLSFAITVVAAGAGATAIPIVGWSGGLLLILLLSAFGVWILRRLR